MSRRFQFSLWQLMLAMTAVAVGTAWIPRIFPYGSGRFTILLAAIVPLTAMFLVAHFFRGVAEFVTGVVLWSLPCLLLSIVCEAIVVDECGRWIGRSLIVPFGIVVGGLAGGAISSFLAGATGGVIAMLHDELS